MKKEKQSFTLIEILVVIVIIGILSSFIFFTINDSVEKAQIAKSKMFSESIRNNLLLNLVSEWKLDGDANDSWGDNDGTPTDVTYLSGNSCINGQCGSFNGSSSYIRIPDSAEFNVGSYVSVFTWVKGGLSNNGIFAQYDFGTAQSSWYIRRVLNTLKVYISDNGTTSIGHRKIYYTGDIFDDDWHFIGFTFNAGVLKIYIDGTEADVTKEEDDAITSIYNSTADVTIGCNLDSDSPHDFFTGSIDEAQIYNAVVSGAQIKENYLSGLDSLYSKGLISFDEYNNRLENYSVK